MHAALTPKELQSNRYIDILPYKHSMPVGDYFNGNLVALSKLQFLITQAPIDILQFHDTLFQQDVRAVVQVSPFIERGIPKVLRYVPLC